MNFTELYQRIRSIEEGAPSEPTAPGGVIKTKNADGTFSYKPKVPGERLSATLPANQAAKTTDKTDNTKKEPTPANESLEECGDMPMGMMGMSSPQGQQDSVTMNISMNGSGAGGIRDLMSILRDIEGSDNADVHSHDVSKLFGGDDVEVAFDEEMADGGFGSATTAPATATAGIDAVTATGNDLASKGIEAPKVNGGGNPMHEALTSRLHQMYQEIKENTNSNSARPTKGKAIDPVRDAPVDVEKQKVKPQANRPGLAPGGDPKLWDIQHELQKRGYKVKPDGLNGPATQKAVEMAQQNHNWIQDTEHPSAVNIGSKIGKTLGDISAWVETTWRNLKASYKYSTYDQNIPYNEDAGQQDLGNGFVLASIEAFGSTRPAVLDTQSNTYFILNQREDGSAIARTPAKYLTIKDGKTGASMGGPATNAAFQKAGLIKESGEKKTMSRAAKGHEKYGKKGMAALAKAGKEGKDLDKIRDKYNKYD